MATSSIQSLREQADNLAAEYEARFAGQSRVTRELADLDSIVSRMRTLLRQVEALPGATRAGSEAATLRTTVKENLDVYEAERKEIARAQARGPAFRDFAELGTAANLVFGCYRRHFAGKSRNTRDLGLLAEMIDDLTRIEREMKDVSRGMPGDAGAQADLKLVSDTLTMYRTERGEIVEARNAGTPEEQAGVLAEVANGQFKLYQDHFAGKARITRRPNLLQRMIDNLEQVRDRMRLLRSQGLAADYNDKNIEIVTENLAMYQNELAEVRREREATRFVDLMGALGGAANEIMEEYSQNFAGQDRRTRDLDLLSRLCDQLGEIGRQMHDLGRAEPNDMNTRNLGIVTDHRVMFEREWATIDDVKKGSAKA